MPYEIRPIVLTRVFNHVTSDNEHAERAYFDNHYHTLLYISVLEVLSHDLTHVEPRRDRQSRRRDET